MKKELKDKFMSLLGDEKINSIINSEEFYYQKALDKYNEFKSFPLLNDGDVENLKDKILKARQDKLSFMDFLSKLNDNPLEHKIIKLIGELISYIDYNAANKNEFNEYEDKRVFSKPMINQYDWLLELIEYKKNNNIEDIKRTAIKKIFQYLEEPENIINIFSETNKKLILLRLFEESNSVDFDSYVINEMDSLNIKVKNPQNKTDVYSTLIYNDEIKKIWNCKKTIWKISHGDNFFSEDERQELLNKKIILVHEDTKKKQGQNFINEMSKGDIFYLCHGSTIKLLGIITSDAQPYTKDGDNKWKKREYTVIKESKRKDKYNGVQRGWSPNYVSTCMRVKNEDLIIFEKEILKPYFDMSLNDIFDENYLKEINQNNKGVEDCEKNNGIRERKFDDLNYILYGPPGTGKTYSTMFYTVAIIENKDFDIVHALDFDTVKLKYKYYKDNGQIYFTTFHQSYSYEEFVEGIKPEIDENTNQIKYSIKNGIFKVICEKAKQNKDKNYVLIIDEINRGNVSKIFGELITLIEKTKRIGQDEEIEVVLPYSQERFGVPQNLYIIGTMNTADRSIAFIDTALRRRFKFIEMMPNSNILENNVIDGVELSKLLEIINKRIEILYDRDHTIGHAYFVGLDGTIDNLSEVFKNKIIPLLQEYFYDDYGKIRLIFADNQVKDEDKQFIIVNRVDGKLFGDDFDTDGEYMYTINEKALTNPEAYIKIYNNEG